MATDPEKLRVIQHWPIPNRVKDVRNFLGMAGYYRRFVAGFGVISKPLTNLMRKGQLFVWNSDTQQAFEALKAALVQAPVLAIPNFAKLFVIETDASGVELGLYCSRKDILLHILAYDWVLRTWGCQLMKSSIWQSCLR